MQDRGFDAAKPDYKIDAPASVAPGTDLVFKIVAPDTIIGLLIKASEGLPFDEQRKERERAIERAYRINPTGTFKTTSGTTRTPGKCTGDDIPLYITHAAKLNAKEHTLTLTVPAATKSTSITLNGVFLANGGSGETFHPVTATVTVGAVATTASTTTSTASTTASTTTSTASTTASIASTAASTSSGESTASTAASTTASTASTASTSSTGVITTKTDVSSDATLFAVSAYIAAAIVALALMF